MERAAPESQRLDKWLWYARFFKTRSQAARHVSDGHVRINAERSSKPARAIQPGDVLTFSQARTIRVVRVLAIGTRRGPAVEAQTLYEDLTEPLPEGPAAARVGPRPTKRLRRRLDAERSDLAGPDGGSEEGPG